VSASFAAAEAARLEERRLAAAERCLAESARPWRLTGIPSRLAGTLDRLGSVRAAAAANPP
jgi:hypothetical protein